MCSLIPGDSVGRLSLSHFHKSLKTGNLSNHGIDAVAICESNAENGR